MSSSTCAFLMIMTKKEYAEKWCDECMHCEWLHFHRYRFDPRDSRGNYVLCFWSDNHMDFMPDDSTCEDMVKVMVLDMKNIWNGCPMYTERMIELYNLDD